jgi:hypothetical protein
MKLRCQGRANSQPIGLTYCLDKRDHTAHDVDDAPLTDGELTAGFTTSGDGVYLNPADAAMTRDQLTAWFRLRGVHDDAFLAELLDEHQGKTLDEMDEVYERMHGSTA